jgi:predicted aspartyl protease
MSSSTNEMVCQATLTNGSISVSRVVVVDGGFTEDLILQPSDIEDLQLGPPLSRMSSELADRSLVYYDVYAPLTLTLALTDGSSVSCEMTPQVLVRPPDEVPVVEVESAERLVGYNGMFKLGLKQDFRNHRLVRRTRRV